jgi:hypothetical protein
VRREDLLHIPVHEEDTVAVRVGQILQEERDDLDRLAANAFQPRLVGVGVERLDAFVLVVATRVAVIGRAGAVAHDLETASLQHAHCHRRPGAWKSRDDDNRRAEGSCGKSL